MTTRTTARTARLWVEYKKSGDRRIRDQLIVLYSPLVKYVAARVAVGLPQHVDGADLVSYGIIGLIDAIDRFDPVRQVKFETYAIPRIRGAIIDELRAIDWVPRSVRAKARAVEQAYATLEATCCARPPTPRWRPSSTCPSRSCRTSSARSPSSAWPPSTRCSWSAGTAASAPPWATPSPTPPPGPVALFEDKESKEILAQAIMQLGDRERTVLSLYYYEGLTLAEIGEILGVTESRVCQIHTKAVLQLRARLSDRTPDGTDTQRRGRPAVGAGPRRASPPPAERRPPHAA